MKLTHFCPECWNETRGLALCPECGADLHQLSAQTYEEKLIGALRHPEPTVPVRDAMVLGRLQYAAATPALIEAAMNTKDPCLQEAVAQALGAIGDRKALPCLEHLRREGALRVRAAAELSRARVTGKTRAD
jgi:HEAT repeat protein